MATIAINISIPDFLTKPIRFGRNTTTNKPMSFAPMTPEVAVAGFGEALQDQPVSAEPSVLAVRLKAALARLGKYLVVRVLPGMLTITTILTMAAMLEVGRYEMLGAALLLAAAVKSFSYQGLRALLQAHLDWRDEGLVFALTPCLIVGASLFFIASDADSGQLLWLFTGLAVLLAQSIQELHLEYHFPRMWLRHRAGVMLARTLLSAAAGFSMIGMSAPLSLVGMAMILVWLLPSLWALIRGSVSTPSSKNDTRDSAASRDVFDLPASGRMTAQAAAAGREL